MTARCSDSKGVEGVLFHIVISCALLIHLTSVVLLEIIFVPGHWCLFESMGRLYRRYRDWIEIMLRIKTKIFKWGGGSSVQNSY